MEILLKMVKNISYEKGRWKTLPKELLCSRSDLKDKVSRAFSKREGFLNVERRLSTLEGKSKMPSSIRWEDLSFYETEDGTSGTQTLACTSDGNCEIVDISAWQKFILYQIAYNVIVQKD